MTSLRSTVARLFGEMAADADDLPDADFVLSPRTVEEAARVLDFASEHRLRVLVWGAGTHQGLGGAFTPDLVVLTGRMDRIVDWRPDDLTVVVEAGVPLQALEEQLAERGQTAVLPERPGPATVGGVVAAGVSGWRRLRYGPTRDRVLEVVMATGDGRVVRSGAQVVKSVTGYGIHRLAVGSLGSLGLISTVALKLWPRGAASATVSVDDPVAAFGVAHRPLAALETPDGASVYLAGTTAEVEAQAVALGGSVAGGLAWPDPPHGEVEISVRVPPASTVDAVSRLSGASFVAAHGVGEIAVAFADADGDAVGALRSWAEGLGGTVVVVRAPDDLGLDPWGAPPATLDLQRRIKSAFDPIGVMAPGRLPGGL